MPIVAGGTGFYLRWFVHGRPSTPAASPQAAQQVQDLLQQVCTSQPRLTMLSASMVCS